MTTRGVVTAGYATGGLDGYHVQTPGTGGDLDTAAHDASDGVFVHSPDSGPNADAGDGAGGWNTDRTAQARALVAFAEELKVSQGTDRVLLAGDFNAYAQEDPMRVLYDAGYANLAPEGEYSYAFDGLVGSLDHVLASPAAAELVTGSDVWGINANESVAFEYSRHNHNVVDLYAPDPYRASDHNPELVGLRWW